MAKTGKSVAVIKHDEGFVVNDRRGQINKSASVSPVVTMPTMLNGTPKHLVDAFVREIMGRRELTLKNMAPQLEHLTKELSGLITAMVDNFALTAKANVTFDQRDITFHNIRWLKGGRVVFDVSYRGGPFVPPDVHLE